MFELPQFYVDLIQLQASYWFEQFKMLQQMKSFFIGNTNATTKR